MIFLRLVDQNVVRCLRLLLFGPIDEFDQAIVIKPMAALGIGDPYISLLAYVRLVAVCPFLDRVEQIVAIWRSLNVLARHFCGHLNFLEHLLSPPLKSVEAHASCLEQKSEFLAEFYGIGCILSNITESAQKLQVFWPVCATPRKSLNVVNMMVMASLFI
jgi:hypothetical protein